MNSLEMKNRTKKFSLDILELLEILPNSKTFKLIENQLEEQRCLLAQIIE